MESCLHRLGSYVFIVFVLIFQGIDTVSGFTTIVINTEVVLDDMFPYFANSNTILFSNITGKILIGSWYFQDNWLQSLGSISNLGIYQKKLSSEQMIEITSGCQHDFVPDISWKDMEWDLRGENIYIYKTNQEKLCMKKQNHWFSLENPVSWHECKQNCYKYLKGHMPSLMDKYKSHDLTAWFMERMFMFDNMSGSLVPFPSGCNRFWLPITDLEEDGVWVDDNSGQLVQYFEWKTGEPNGKTTQNCGNLVPPGGWTDRPCHVGKCCVCENDHQPYLLLRGLCSQSKLDTIYVVNNPEESGKMVYLGIYGTVIEYDDTSLTWTARIHRDSQVVTVAYTRAPKESLLLGTYQWKVYNDSRECTIEESYSAVLTLSGCSEDQFRD